jgi:hypothetical protein
LLTGLARGGVLAKDGLFVMEQAAGEPLPELGSWRLVADRTYGDARLCLFRPEG